MTVPTNTVQTFAMVGIREDLSDVITNIAPMDVPFYSMCKKGTAKNRTPEWLKDTLAAGDPTNKRVEGDAAGDADAGSQPTRLKNVVQLMDKVVEVSTTAQAVDAAGRSNELKFQVAKKGKELKRDIELRITGNFASVVGNASTAGELGGAEAWIETNVSRGNTGASGGFNTGTGLVDKADDGDARTYTEDLLKDVVRQAWEAGGDPSIIMCTGSKKQTSSGFQGIATQYKENPGKRQATILGAADVYVSDFGEHRIVPNRFMGAGTGRSPASSGLYAGRSVLVLDPKTWMLKFLQPFKTEPLAKLGHSDKRMLSCEFTLAVTDEAANGVIADLS
jgi:hypothetical protein